MVNNLDSLSHKSNFEEFLDYTEKERPYAQKRRDYRDLKQWESEEVSVLKSRKQAPVVIDHFSQKIDQICGIEIQKRSYPKAFPRTKKHEKASQVITSVLRYVGDNTSLNEIFTDVFENKIVEGYGGVIIETKFNGREIEILPRQLHWDRIYFDPHSRDKDFKDSKYIGLTIWMDVKEVKAMFNGVDVDALLGRSSSESIESSQFGDRPNTWIDKTRNRVRVNHEFFIHDQVWHEVKFSGDVILQPARPSQILDEFGEPACPIELTCDFIDSENNRYGWSERLIYPQKEINHRRSKALHLLSSAKVIADKGAFENRRHGDARAMVLEELRKPQGYIEKIPGKDVQIDQNIEMGQAQLAFYQEAKNEINSVGVNPELAGRTDQAISGRAFMARQQGGMTEITRIFSCHSNFKKRVYRQIWARIKQFWSDEQWIRVTDNEDSMSWVGLNIQVSLAHKLVMDKLGIDYGDVEDKFGAEIQQAISQNPQLGQIVEVLNNVAELDMDVMIEESPDNFTIMQEQFDSISRILQTNPSPEMFEFLVRLSSMPNKQEVLDMFKGDDEEQKRKSEQQQEQQQLINARQIADLQKTQAEKDDKLASANLKNAQVGRVNTETARAFVGLENIG